MKEFMPGKLYKALCTACAKPKDNRPAIEKPWYSPTLKAVIATNAYMIIALDYDADGETSPCVYHGDTARVLARDVIGFDTPLEREPVSSDSVSSCFEGLDNHGAVNYDAAILEPIIKLAKAGNYLVNFALSPNEVLRGYFTDNGKPVGRFMAMPKRV